MSNNFNENRARRESVNLDLKEKVKKLISLTQTHIIHVQ